MKKKSTLWKILTAFLSILLIIFVVGTTIANSYRAVIDSYFDISPYEIERSAADADLAATEYFKSDFVLENASWKGQASKNGDEAYYDNDALQDSNYALGEAVEGEGAVLLFNNGALPLAKDSKVSAFSISSRDLAYGGTGSGSVNTDTAPTLKSALEDAGFKVNETLVDFYKNGAAKDYVREAKDFFQTGVYAINEAPWSVFTSEVKNSFATYGDAAIMVISREGGEDNDLPRTNSDFEANRTGSSSAIPDSNTTNDGMDGNYLSLSKEEREILKQLKTYKQEGVFSSIILLVNSSNAIQYDFLADEGIEVDAALWIGAVGYTGINAVADILAGDINPSGSLPDTFYVNNLNTPAMVNFGKTKFNNWTTELDELGADCYTVYEEGIYVGYKYTESRYFDKVMNQNNTGDYNYNELVAFPFGYGMSYTTFSYSNIIMEETEKTFEYTVTVTNTGSAAGKEVVQLYMSAPYTDYDKEMSIEKAAVELVGFAKTGILESGASEQVTVSVEKESMKCYDSLGEKSYILEAGDYYFIAARDAHQATNNLLSFMGKGMEDGMDAEGDPKMVDVYHQKKTDMEIYRTSKEGVEITNQFDDADLRIYSNGEQAELLNLLSRKDWVGTYPEAEDHANGKLTFTADMDADVSRSENTGLVEDPNAEMPLYGQKNELTLASLIGVPYDDERWDLLIDQMTYEEQEELCSKGFHQTAAVETIAKPATKDTNGPIGITQSFMGSTSKGMAYPCCPIMSATMNVELIQRMGEQIGLDALHGNFQGLYAPGVNIHRTPYCGRNYEYYSEDSVLSGLVGQAETKGIQSKGMYVYVKHFALNDQETLRHGICTFASEQTIRENYLKAFEYVIDPDKGNAHAVMTAFNRVGVVWAGAHHGLQTNVLRDEWGFDGFTISDAWIDISDKANSGNKYGNAAAAILAGGDTLDGSINGAYSAEELKNSPTFCQALRESSKRICYTVANSNAMNGLDKGDRVITLTSWWQTALYSVTAFLAMLLLLSAVMLVRAIKMDKRKV